MQCLQCNRKLCLSYVPIFQVLQQEEMIELSKVITHRTYKKGDYIYLAGDLSNHLFVVRKGTIKLTHVLEDGHEQVVRIVLPGDFFGELALFQNTPMIYNAIVIEEAELCVLQGNFFKELLIKVPHLQLNMLQILSERLEIAEKKLTQAHSQDANQRLAAFLLQCSENGIKQTFRLPVNKTDIASILGTSRETLSRKLSSLQKKGIISLSGREIKICNLDALKELVN